MAIVAAMNPNSAANSSPTEAASAAPLQPDLLTAVRLQINPALGRSARQSGRVILRAPSSPRRLVLTPVQAALLQDFFSAPTTVPSALASVLGKNDTPPWTVYGCPPLSEFYELILQAHDAHVLIVAGEPPVATHARPWPFKLPVLVAEVLGSAALVGGVVAIVRGQWQAPTGGQDWIIGWLIGCALLSVWQALAASTLLAGGGEVRQPRFQWLTLLPHF